MEEVPANKRVPDVEAEANYEGNDALLLFSRLASPLIKEQVINFLYKDEEFRIGQHYDVIVFDENGEAIPDTDGKFGVKTVREPFKPLSREEIEKEFEDRLRTVVADTPIDFTDEQPCAGVREIIPLNFCINTGEVVTLKQKSIIEAHEKGHVLRPYLDGSDHCFSQYFSGGFDLTKAVYTEEDYKVLSAMLLRFHEKQLDFEEAKKQAFSYLFSPREIAERMSQLKNYFGMKSDEVFTKEHLDYVRNHYVKDTGFNNGMTHFFQAITPETEEKFLEIINNAGI